MPTVAPKSNEPSAVSLSLRSSALASRCPSFKGAMVGWLEGASWLVSPSEGFVDDGGDTPLLFTSLPFCGSSASPRRRSGEAAGLLLLLREDLDFEGSSVATGTPSYNFAPSKRPSASARCSACCATFLFLMAGERSGGMGFPFASRWSITGVLNCSTYTSVLCGNQMYCCIFIYLLAVAPNNFVLFSSLLIVVAFSDRDLNRSPKFVISKQLFRNCWDLVF